MYPSQIKGMGRKKENGLDLKELDREMQRLLDHQTQPTTKK